MPFPMEFKKCPSCGCADTACRLACADEPSIPKDTFVSLEKVITPIQQPSTIVGPFIKAIVAHYDICARCGTRYCTKVEKTNLPVVAQQPLKGNSPFFPNPGGYGA